MKVYECIIDDGKEVYKSKAVAKNKEDLLDIYGGDGDFIKITDISDTILAPPRDYERISNAVERLQIVLLKENYNDIERILICELLNDFLVNR